MVASATGEPVITSMSLDQDLSDDGRFVPEQSISAYQLWQLQKEKRDLRQDYLDHWEASVRLTGTGRPVDAVISPVAAFPAPPHGLDT